MRRPVAYIVVITAALLALGAPFLRVEFGGVDYRVLPEHFESRQVAETLEQDFAPNATSPIEIAVVFDGPVDQPSLDEYVGSVASVPGVTGVQVAGIAGGTARVVASYASDPSSPAAKATVADIRALPAPPGSEALVGGETAALVDLLASLRSTLPWMGLFVAVVTLVLLFLAFGSVLLPVKAVLMNALSITASFGALVWIFQDGHLSGLLGFTPTGTFESTQPILMLAILFGLSMDCELFLLSRIREQWDKTGDNTQAVATGLQRTGAIITSAALLLVIVIGGFATSEITFIKMIGVGMIIAIIIDATVIRTLLVPATMRVMGRANWWAPRPLRRVYDRFGFRETDADAPRSYPSPIRVGQ
jgi:RND superfamily putative drug exporter